MTVDRRARLALSTLRALAAAPLFLGVAATFLSPLAASDAVGAGAAFAACGAFAVIAPRAELVRFRLVDPVMRGLASAAFLAAGTLALMDAVMLTSAAWDSPILWAAASPGLGTAASAWWLAWLVLSGDRRGPVVAGLFAGAAPLAAGALWVLDRFGARVEPANTLLAFDTSHIALFTAMSVGAILLLSPAGRAATSRAATDATAGRDDFWFGVVMALHALLTMSASAECMRAVILLTWNSVGMIVGTNALAWALAGSSLCLALSVVSRSLLQRAPVAGRLVALATSGVLVVMLVVAAVLRQVTVGSGQALASAAIPLIIAAALVVPPSLRRKLGPVLPRDGWQGLGLTHEPQYEGAPKVPLPRPVTPMAEQLFSDLEFGHGRT